MEANEFEQLIGEAETRLDRLRALFEQYFQGIERLEPAVLRKDFERRLELLRKQKPRNTALRFRLQTLQQRYNTLTTYWTRVSRQIEEGGRPGRRLRTRTGSVTGSAAGSSPDTVRAPPDEFVSVSQEIDLREIEAALRDYRPPEDHDTLPPASDTEEMPALDSTAAPTISSTMRPERRDSIHSRRTSPRPEATRRVEAGGGGTELSPTRLRQLYAEYADARRQAGQSMEAVSFDLMVRRVEATLPAVRAKNPGKAIDFEVVVRDGRVGLKPKLQ